MKNSAGTIKKALCFLLSVLLLAGVILPQTGPSLLSLKARAASSTVVVSYSPASGHLDNSSPPDGNYTFYYGEEPYISLMVTSDTYVFDATLYVYKDGSLYTTKYWHDVKAELGLTVTCFRYWSQPIAFYDIGTYSAYFDFTYNTNGPNSSVRADWTSGTVNFEVVDRPMSLNLSTTSVNLSIPSNTTKAVTVWTDVSVSYNYYFQYDIGSSTGFYCSWGEWDSNNRIPLNFTATGKASNQTVTVRVRKSSDSSIVCSRTITVNVSVPTYTVSYNANGGSGAPSSQTKTYNEDLTLSGVRPTRTLFHFLGWNTSSTATSATYQPQGIYSQNANATLYAVWESAPSISSNVSRTASIGYGGQVRYYKFTPSTTAEYVIYSSSDADTYVTLYNSSGTSITTNDDSGEGNNFRLAYTLSSGSVYYYGVKYYSSSTTGSIPIKFGRTYKVTYDANGGSGAPSAQTKDYGTPLTLSSQKPSRTNYSFAGWATSKSSSTVSYESGGKYSAESDITLYAVWRDSSIPQGSISSTNNIADYQTVTLTMQDNNGIAGYYWGTSSSYANNTFYSTSSTTATKTVTGSGTYYLVVKDTAGNVSQPSSIRFSTVSFNANSGTGAPAKQLYLTADGTTLSSQKPTKSYTVSYNPNYTGASTVSKNLTCGFLGWNRKQDGSGSNYQAGEYFAAEADETLYAQWRDPAFDTTAPSARTGYTFLGWYTSMTGGTKLSASSTVTSATTVYAHWSANTYSVIFDAQGGTASYYNNTYTYDSSYGSLPTAYRTGYTFLGWFTEKTGGTQVSTSTTVKITKETKLYAHWSANSYTVTFDPNGGICGTATKTVVFDNTYGTLPVPEKNNCVFVGWFTSAENGTEIKSDIKVSTAKAHTLYAHWKKILTVSYDANGGWGAPAAQTYTEGESIRLSTAEPRKSYTVSFDANGGYSDTKKYYLDCTFSGWEDRTGTVYFPGAEFSASYNETLLAVWDNASLPALPSADLTGYTFTGWYTAKVNGTKVNPGDSIQGDTTLYAHWSINTYTVYLNASGGIVDPISIQVVFNQPYGTLPVPEREGYTFAGWFTSATGGVEVTKDTVLTVAGNTTVYAHWKKNVSITYDANGGAPVPPAQQTYENEYFTVSDTVPALSFSLNFNTDSDATAPTAQNCTAVFLSWLGSDGSRYQPSAVYKATADLKLTAQWQYPQIGNLPVLQRKGFSFLGWFYTNGTEAKQGDVVTRDTVLWAKWSRNTHTVYFNAGGGTTESSEKTVSYGLAYGELPSAERKGYQFLGWYTAAQGGAAVTASTIMETDASHTLYAHWKAKTSVLFFNANGGSCSTEKKTVTFDQRIGELPSAQRSGYAFAGWYTDAENGYPITENTVVSFDRDTTVYAHWTILPTYIISYDANGGTGAPESQVKTQTVALTLSSTVPQKKVTVRYEANGGVAEKSVETLYCTFTHWLAQSAQGSKTYMPGAQYTDECAAVLYAQWDPAKTNVPAVQRSGYRFTGWYTDAALTKKADDEISVASDTTLYAGWTAEQYTVRFDARGGTCDTTEKTVTFNEKYGTLPVPEREGYTFAGWFTSATGGVEVTKDTVLTVAGNTTVYAQWKKNVSITFDANGGVGAPQPIETFSDTAVTLSSKPPVLQIELVLDPAGGNVNVTSKTLFPEFTGWTDGEGNVYLPGGTYRFSDSAVLTAQWQAATVGELPVPEKNGHTFEGWYSAAEGGVKADGYSVFLKDTTLFAHWKANSYTIYLNANGGSAETDRKTVSYGEKTGELPVPERTGYDFKGWYTASGILFTSDSVYLLASDVVLFAKWEAKVIRVLFRTEGGELPYAEKTVTYDDYFGSLPIPTWKDHVFSGWYTNPINGERITEGSKVQSVDNMTLYARWVSIISIRYDANGGSAEPSEQRVNVGDTLYISSKEPIKYAEISFDSGIEDKPVTSKRIALVFESWNTKQDGSGDTYYKNSPASFSQDTVLYAQWKAVKIGPLPVIEKEGYLFDGWFSSPGVQTPITENTLFGSDTVVSARMHPINYTLRFMDGNTQINSVSCTYDVPFSLSQIDEPVKDGYTFLGWSKRENGEKSYESSDTVINLSAENGDAIQFYAVWHRNPDVTSLTYSFVNSNKGFNYPDDYLIPLDSYRYIFGKNGMASSYYKLQTKWMGNCFGMSSTSVLFNSNSDVEVYDFNDAAFAVSDLLPTDRSDDFGIDVTRFIEAMQVSQFAPVVQNEICNNKDDIKGLTEAIRAGKKTNNLPILCMFSPNNEGHAILGYDVQKVSSTETRILVYDNNYPFEERYMTLYTEENGDITGWSYFFNITHEWGSKYDFWISYVPYELMEFVWQNRGDPNALQMDDYNLFYTNSTAFTLYDIEGNKVGEANENGFVSYRDDVFEVKTLTGEASERSGYKILLSVDMYQVKNDDHSLPCFEANMINVNNLMEIKTHTDEVTFIVSDALNSNTAYVSGAGGEEFEITLTSTQNTKENVIVLTGTVADDEIQISLTNNQLIYSIGNTADPRLMINGKIIDLNGGEPPLTDYAPGDVDNDGALTAADARLALRMAVGLETFAPESPEYRAADVDKDGTVTAADARMILRAAVGLEDPNDW